MLLAAVSALWSSACTGPRGPSRPPILLLTVDTLRADHLGEYGYDRQTSPGLARLAADGVVFEHAFTTAPKTSPAYASMFTGHYPYRHGLQSLGQELADQNETLAERLSAGGYRTAGFVSSTVMIDRLSGLGQGFAHWDDRMTSREANRDNYERVASQTTASVLEWLPQDLAGVFVFVHLIDPHGPYTPPSLFLVRLRRGRGPLLKPGQVPEFQRLEGATAVGDYIDAYDAEVLYATGQLSRILDELDERGVYDDSLIIVTADHGESFGEDGYFFRHGKTLHEASTRVPLIIKPPGGRADVVEPRWIDSVSLVDIAPTVLDYAGVDGPAQPHGSSLRPVLEGRAEAVERLVFSQRRTAGGDHRGVHGKRGSLYVGECGARDEGCVDTYLARREDGSVLELDAATETRAALRAALDAFAAEAEAYKVPFEVTHRYRPGNKDFVRQFVEDHNTRLEQLDARDVEALERLGYLER